MMLTMIAILGASVTTFVLLVRRWTTQRQWVSLAEWAKQRGFGFRSSEPAALPSVLAPLREANVQIRLHLSDTADAIATVVQLETDPSPGRQQANRWNTLVRRRPKRQPAPAGLRPVSVSGSLLDLFGLSQFPALNVGQRFTVLATRSSDARQLVDSASRTLLPADIGLLLVDEWIVLDFSTRPFDPIELDRMIALAQQIGQMI
jgi:hypothetical protein